MDIKKATEILSLGTKSINLDPDKKEALKLGVEALKRCKMLADSSLYWAGKPLPGETK